MNYDCRKEFEIYLQRKIAKNKQNKDNKPYTKRERRLMWFAFEAGWNHNDYFQMKKAMK